MKHVFRFLPLIFAVAIAFGCGGGSSNMGSSSTQLRSVQSSGDISGFDVQMDGNTLFAHGSLSTYKTVGTGTHTFAVTEPGTTVALTTVAGNFATGSSQTLVVAGAVEDQSLTAFLVAEDTTAPLAGKLKVRFVQGAHDVGPIDIYVADAGAVFPTAPTIANVAYKAASDVLVRADQPFSVCWTKAGTTMGPFGGGSCGIVETFTGEGLAKNSTLVLSDPPIDPNAPPGAFGFILFRSLAN